MSRRPSQPDAVERQPRKRARGRLQPLWLLLAVLCSLSISCKPNKRYDLIEAELRTRERELAETRNALEQSRNLNRAYVQQSQNGGVCVPNPGTPAYIPVQAITLARGTGGVDEDGVPGDEGLMVVVVPKDEDGQAVKVPAKVQIAAWEVTPAGMKNSIGTWEVPAEKVRPTWRSGFVSTGYFVAVPWQTYPSTEKVRVAVRLTTLDGRTFETDRDILVRLPSSPRPGSGSPTQPRPPAPRPREPLFPDALPSGLPPGVEELPPPARTSQRGGAILLPPVKE